MGGGGGDDYSAKQAEMEARKQQARDKLNLSFGVAPTGGPPSRSLYTSISSTPQQVGEGDSPFYPEVFDQAGYDAAMAEYNAAGDTAARNKAAREALYSGVRQNAFDAGKRGLEEKKSNAARDLKFALFAQGLNGGSVDLDQNATLGRTYNEGLLDLGAKADAVKTDMLGSDENTRLGLLQSIDAGMDQGSALSSALQQMRVNSDRAAAEAQGTSLGDLFGEAGLLYTKSNAARGRQAGNDYFQSNYGTSRVPRNPGSSGIVTSTG
jgi:hypothetical protein